VNARVVVEKPFGHDLASAIELSEKLQGVFTEDEIFRIDHYLGKETVQNIVAFRFANSIFEPVWNSTLVDHVQITVAEEIGVEGRGSYYDRAGALRDIVQNHALQLLALVAMEPPLAFEASSMRDEKVKVLRAIRPIVGDEVERSTVRGQYAKGWVLGEHVPAYREEPNVAPGSLTETFAALRLFIDNWRWANVPFYIRAGKCLPVTAAEALVEFRRPPARVFREAEHLGTNYARFRIQPKVEIALGARTKTPGEQMVGEDVELCVSNLDPEAMAPYDRLLVTVTATDGVAHIATAGFHEMLPLASPPLG